jgi:tellurite methyltransferase
MTEKAIADPWWEASFRDMDTSTFGDVSSDVLSIADKVGKGSRVLDVGCGDGRVALFFAERGCVVDAIDYSPAAILKLKFRARERGLHEAIRANVMDMRDLRIDTIYDVIVAHGSLQLVERNHWSRLLQDFKKNTRPGGYHVMVVLTDSIPPPEDLAPYCVALFKDGELLTYYDDWTVLMSKSWVKEDEHPGGIRHQHPLNRVVARKPTP